MRAIVCASKRPVFPPFAVVGLSMTHRRPVTIISILLDVAPSLTLPRAKTRRGGNQKAESRRLFSNESETLLEVQLVISFQRAAEARVIGHGGAIERRVVVEQVVDRER